MRVVPQLGLQFAAERLRIGIGGMVNGRQVRGLAANIVLEILGILERRDRQQAKEDSIDQAETARDRMISSLDGSLRCSTRRINGWTRRMPSQVIPTKKAQKTNASCPADNPSSHSLTQLGIASSSVYA
jgi:hypothetical protein